MSVLPFVFVDLGHVDDSATTPSADLASVGVGARMGLSKQVELTLEAARTLEPAQLGTGNETRVHFNLTGRF